MDILGHPWIFMDVHGPPQNKKTTHTQNKNKKHKHNNNNKQENMGVLDVCCFVRLFDFIDLEMFADFQIS